MVEFNYYGTLLAIATDSAIVLIMDFITKEIVRIFDYYNDKTYDYNNNPQNFLPYSNASYVIFDPTQKTDDAKQKKHTPPRDKDIPCKANISSIEFSRDGGYLLVCYQVVCDIIVWDIINCQ